MIDQDKSPSDVIVSVMSSAIEVGLEEIKTIFNNIKLNNLSDRQKELLYKMAANAEEQLGHKNVELGQDVVDEARKKKSDRFSKVKTDKDLIAEFLKISKVFIEASEIDTEEKTASVSSRWINVLKDLVKKAEEMS